MYMETYKLISVTKKSGLVALLFTLSALPACNKSFLERQPQGSTNEITLATREGVNGLLIGAYNYLNNGWLYCSDYLFAEMPGDCANGGSYGFAAWGLKTFIFDANFFIYNDKWVSLYTGIQRANDAIRVLEKVPEGKMTDAEKTQVKAEAVFLRAFSHLKAKLIYGNIPYIDETTNFDNANYNVTNTESAWPMIEADFQFAADNLTETKAEAGRANSWAAKAFLAKTYMFQDKFTEAKPLLEDIIANGKTANGQKYGLVDKYFDTYNPATKNSKESIFAVQNSVNDGSGGANGNTKSGLGYTGPYGGPITTWGWLQPAISLANAYKTDPVTGLPLLYTFNDEVIKTDQGLTSDQPFTPHDGPLDPRIDWCIGRRGIPFLDWGVHVGFNWIPQQLTSGPFSMIKSVAPQSQPDMTENFSKAVNETAMRFADVLLWAAEVEVEIGSLAKAEEYVNLVRARAANPAGFVFKYLNDNDPLGGYSTTPAANYFIGLYTGQFMANGKDYARDAVRFERKLELAMENHRFYDLQRWDNGTGYMADMINGFLEYEDQIPNYQMEEQALFRGGSKFTKNKNEFYPIPQAQIDLSTTAEGPTLTQNPGY